MKKLPSLLLAAAAFACANLDAQTPQTATNEFKYSGTVVDASGNPVAGATVEFRKLADASETNRQTTLSGADGTFSFKLYAAERGNLVAKKAGMATGWRLLSYTSGEPLETEGKLVLTPPSTLAGLVTDESNQPVAGAEVYVYIARGEQLRRGSELVINTLSGKRAREQFSTRTDAAGAFRIENFPTNATAILGVDSPGKTLSISDDDILRQTGSQAGEQAIKLVLVPAGRIEGKLVAGDTNQPLPVPQLSLIPDFGGFVGEFPSANSSAEGAFTFDKVPPGSYRVHINFPTNNAGWVAERAPVTVTSGQTLRDFQVKVVRGSLLEVTVLDNNRKPQPKTTVVAVTDNSVQFNGLTDSNGLAKIFVLPGDYRVSAHQQRMFGQTSTSVNANATNRLEIEVAENISSGGGSAIKVTGILRQPDGKPAANIPVQIIGSYREDNPPKTDAEGKFALQWTPNQGGNEQQECLLARDAEHNLAVAQDLDEETTNVNLTLAPGLTLFGRVLSENKPVINVDAALVFWRGNSGRWMRGFAITNTPGQYEIPALPPGRKYGVIVSAPGYGQKQNHTLEISDDPGRQELDPVELSPANMKIAGQVLDADDKPVARCYVYLSGNNQPNGNARTDSEGRFRFDKVCEGTVRLSANNSRFSGSISAEAGDTNVVLHLGQSVNYSSSAISHTLRGVVADENGKPATNAQLAVFPNNGARWFKTGTNGEYKLTWAVESWQVQNGSPLLVFRDKSRNLAGTEEIPDETTNLNVTLKPALTLSGQVKDSDGAPLAASQITLWLKAGNSYQSLDQNSTIPVNAEGRFEIKCLPLDGNYMVSASAKGFGRVQQQLVPEYETNHMELPAFVLNRADRIIAGQILRNDEKPAPGANVQISGDGQPEGSVTTDSKGRFQFKVCEGQVRLFVYSPNDSGSAQRSVEAGDTNIVLTLSTSSGVIRESPRRPSLKGSPLPDLTAVNLTAPAGKPLLICLFDAAQRPSRHALTTLSKQAADLQNKNISLAGIQSATITDEAFDEWKTSASISFPIGRVPAKSDKTKWASSVGALPWLILTDANHRVIAEGFAIGDLDAQLQSLPK